MTFALYRRPGGVVFLDDDPDYVDMLAQVMPCDLYVRMFVRPVACIESLLKEPLLWEADAWAQQEIVNRWREGASLILQILAYWRHDGTTRFGLTQVCVVDYSMPAMSGLRVLSELTGWSGARVLLTGRADEQLAVSAFNRGLIDKFIAKQLPELRLRLTEAIRSLQSSPNGQHQQTWRATLTREQHALLCIPAISQALADLVLKQGWIEHVVIGAPFGVLALDSKGRVNWLQLEPVDKLQELAEIAESQGWDARIVEDIRSGRKLLDLELQLALGAQHQPVPHEAFVIGDGEPALLYAALFAVHEFFCPGSTLSHESFMASRNNRQLQD